MTELTARIALSMLAVYRFSPSDILRLFGAAGGASPIIENICDLKALLPDINPSVAQSMKQINVPEIVAKAEAEQEWAERYKVRIITIEDTAYPSRMKGCVDAPLVLYAKGDTDLNPRYSLAIVGTRHCTRYGEDVITDLITELAKACPEVSIVSGLAYGVDINSHRMSVQKGLTTIGVVAHGLDTLYPALHRADAKKIIELGGALVTEYPTHTRPEPRNFLQRNRIIAAMTDATIVVESAVKGGSLATARLAQDYSREVFAVPGPIKAKYSEGCNNLIKDDRANLFTGIKDILEVLNWQTDQQIRSALESCIERSLFPVLTTQEQEVVGALRNNGDSTPDNLSTLTSIPTYILQSLLLKLEMRGIVRASSGGQYHLIE